MLSARLRRAGALVAAALLAAVPAPAAAVAAPVAPTIHFPHLALLPGGVKFESIYLTRDDSFVLHDVTVTLDATRAAGVATVRPYSDPGPCTATGAVSVCTFDTLTQEEYIAYVAMFEVRAVDGAAVGDEGTVTVSVASREFPAFSRSSRITIAEAVELETAGETVMSRTAAPGQTFGAPLGVRNTGDKPIAGVEIFFFLDPWYEPAKRYSNCYYGAGAAYCHFATELAPGTAYATSEPVDMRIRRDFPAPGVIGSSFHWHTSTDNRDNRDLVRSRGAQAGRDGELRLVTRPELRAAPPQTDVGTGIDSQWIIADVTGMQGADVAAVGASVRGAVGSTVVAEVGARNLGPAFAAGFPEPAAVVTVTPPAGTTVVTVPEGCAKDGAAYVCATDMLTFDPGKAVTWRFGLRIDKAGERAGSVRVKGSEADPEAANNTAKLVVGQPTAGTGAGASNGDDDGDQPTLPITGAPAGLLAGVGAALLAAGMVLVLATRRRRPSAG